MLEEVGRVVENVVHWCGSMSVRTQEQDRTVSTEKKKIISNPL